MEKIYEDEVVRLTSKMAKLKMENKRLRMEKEELAEKAFSPPFPLPPPPEEYILLAQKIIDHRCPACGKACVNVTPRHHNPIIS